MKPLLIAAAILSAVSSAAHAVPKHHAEIAPLPIFQNALVIAPTVPVRPSLDLRYLDQTRWTIATINGKAPTTLGGPPTLIFGDGTLSVETGCRGFRATVPAVPSVVMFEIVREPVIARACADVLEDQELAIGTVIATASDVFVARGDTLTIKTAKGAVLTAVPLEP